MKFRCKICGYLYSRKDTLKDHIRGKHNARFSTTELNQLVDTVTPTSSSSVTNNNNNNNALKNKENANALAVAAAAAAALNAATPLAAAVNGTTAAVTTVAAANNGESADSPGSPATVAAPADPPKVDIDEDKIII